MVYSPSNLFYSWQGLSLCRRPNQVHHQTVILELVSHIEAELFLWLSDHSLAYCSQKFLYGSTRWQYGFPMVFCLPTIFCRLSGYQFLILGSARSNCSVRKTELQIRHVVDTISINVLHLFPMGFASDSTSLPPVLRLITDNFIRSDSGDSMHFRVHPDGNTLSLGFIEHQGVLFITKPCICLGNVALRDHRFIPQTCRKFLL